jgi:hypothetical protein
MRKLSAVLFAFMLFSFISADNTITDKERKYAVTLLQDSHKALERSIEGLSDAQLTYQSSESSWSIEGNMKHLAFVEQAIMGMVEEALKKPANPEMRAEIDVTDEQMVRNYEDRSTKGKTGAAMEPQNISIKSTAEALASLKQDRAKSISFINSTDADLRNHVIKYPFGTRDCYQSVLLLGAHMNRHIKQIEEVKSQPHFPKN